MATELNGYFGEMSFEEVCEKVRDLCSFEIDVARRFNFTENDIMTRHKNNAYAAEHIYCQAMAKAERRIKRIRERAARVAARAMRQRGLGEFATAIESGDYSDIVF